MEGGQAVCPRAPQDRGCECGVPANADALRNATHDKIKTTAHMFILSMKSLLFVNAALVEKC